MSAPAPFVNGVWGAKIPPTPGGCAVTNTRLAKDIQHFQDSQWAVPLDSDNPTPSTPALADTSHPAAGTKTGSTKHWRNTNEHRQHGPAPLRF
jgi:hypothetical protein